MGIYTDKQIAKAAKEKEAIIKSRERSSCLRNPLVVSKDEWVASRCNKKIKRAVRNLKKMSTTPTNEQQ
jgi:hypothetical protein